MNRAMYRVQSVLFRREKDSPEEPGLLFSDGRGPILDAQGKRVETVWSYLRDGLINLDLSHVFKEA